MFDKLSKIDQLYAQSLLEKCKDCKGIDYCKQEMVGLTPIVVHDKVFNKYSLGYSNCKYARGRTNDVRIKDYVNWEADNKKEIYQSIIDNNNLYLWGDVGVGKTHGLYYLANVYNKRGKNVYIDFFSNMVKRIKSDMNRKLEQDEQSFTDYLQKVDYLFIDDLGNEYSSEYIVSEVLLPIIDYRYVNKKPTFITSNYTIKELYAIYTKKIQDQDVAQKKVKPLVSRLKTFGEVELKGRNWRL